MPHEALFKSTRRPMIVGWNVHDTRSITEPLWESSRFCAESERHKGSCWEQTSGPQTTSIVKPRQAKWEKLRRYRNQHQEYARRVDSQELARDAANQRFKREQNEKYHFRILNTTLAQDKKKGCDDEALMRFPPNKSIAFPDPLTSPIRRSFPNPITNTGFNLP
mmetsp:Transcript_2906/g.5475  ORF Transcript_2906/g.5475 Transcript_2906/m.5475 type:complete len:164 (+) Transcript_2906:1-492(+)